MGRHAAAVERPALFQRHADVHGWDVRDAFVDAQCLSTPALRDAVEAQEACSGYVGRHSAAPPP